MLCTRHTTGSFGSGAQSKANRCTGNKRRLLRDAVAPILMIRWVLFVPATKCFYQLMLSAGDVTNVTAQLGTVVRSRQPFKVLKMVIKCGSPTPRVWSAPFWLLAENLNEVQSGARIISRRYFLIGGGYVMIRSDSFNRTTRKNGYLFLRQPLA